MNTKRIYIIIGVLLIILVIMSVVYNSFKKNTQQSEHDTPTGTEEFLSPTPVTVNNPVQFKPQTIQNIPTLAPDEGQGLDLNSPQIQQSIKEIEKISRNLPYSKSFTTSNKIAIEILIPPVHLQENPWTLTVHITGPDYQIPPNDPQAKHMELAFQEAANDVYYWLKGKQVNTENIIIQWGDRAFIQQRSQEWLQ